MLLGFVLPALWLLARCSGATPRATPARLAVGTLRQWSWASFRLAAIAALLATLLALALGFALRRPAAIAAGDALLAASARGSLSLGYAVPGAVIAIGILLPVGWMQARWPDSGVAALFTGTVVGVLFAYLVRFSAVALQSVEAGYARMPMQPWTTPRACSAPVRGGCSGQLHLPLLSGRRWPRHCWCSSTR